jgi:hypothetical protein
MKLRAVALAVAMSTTAVAQGQPPGAAAAADPILAKAFDHGVAFLEQFSHVVGEEEYDQTYTRRWFSPVPRKRTLTSEVLFAILPDGTWQMFRDVLKVDGRRVADREARLARLLSSPSESALTQADAISTEGARYNLTDVGTLDSPLNAVALLQPRYRDRLRFDPPRPEGGNRRTQWVIGFHEIQSPSIFQNRDGSDLSVSGSVWLDETGRIMRTILNPDELTRITTEFATNAELGMDVPTKMIASYAFRVNETFVGVATYTRFRKFNVTTTESVR